MSRLLASPPHSSDGIGLAGHVDHRRPLGGREVVGGPPVAHLAVAVRPGHRDNATAEAILLRVQATADGLAVRVVDPPESPWSGERHLGRLLERPEALVSPLLDTVLHVAGHVARDVATVAAYLDA